MRRARTLILVFLVLIIFAVVGFVAYTQYFAKPAEPAQPAYIEVYIAAQPISPGGVIAPEQLATIKIAPENVIEVMYTIDEQADLVGKIAKFQLDQGVVITSSMVGEPSATAAIPGPNWARLIPTGSTAISIPVNRFSVAGYGINTGAYVNLNACFLFVDVDPTFQSKLPNKLVTLTGLGLAENMPILSLAGSEPSSDQGRLELDPSLQLPYYLIGREDQRPRMVCQTLLQDVQVMKRGNFSLEKDATLDTPFAPPTTDANGNPVPGDPGPQDIVTLIVSPQDSVTLTYLLNMQQDSGDGAPQTRFLLTLRNPDDRSRQPTESATLQFLLSQYNIPVPAKLPYALEPALAGLMQAQEPIATP